MTNRGHLITYSEISRLVDLRLHHPSDTTYPSIPDTMVLMSACTTPQQMDEARTRLTTAMATMGKAEAVRSIVIDFFARVDALQVATGQVWFSGTKAPEVRLTLAEQIDAMCARVAAKAQEVAA